MIRYAIDVGATIAIASRSSSVERPAAAQPLSLPV
jgi:hypothetical protein